MAQGHSWPQLAGDIEARAVAVTAAYIPMAFGNRKGRAQINKELVGSFRAGLSCGTGRSKREENLAREAAEAVYKNESP